MIRFLLYFKTTSSLALRARERGGSDMTATIYHTIDSVKANVWYADIKAEMDDMKNALENSGIKYSVAYNLYQNVELYSIEISSEDDAMIFKLKCPYISIIPENIADCVHDYIENIPEA
jgi:hypothetical protein